MVNFAGKSNAPPANLPSSSNGQQSYQILCCAYNANGTVFVTGSSDTYARVCLHMYSLDISYFSSINIFGSCLIIASIQFI